MQCEDHVVGAALAGRPTREDRRDYSAGLAETEAADPIQRLLDLLEGATLARHGTIRLPGGRVVWVRPVERQP